MNQLVAKAGPEATHRRLTPSASTVDDERARFPGCDPDARLDAARGGDGTPEGIVSGAAPRREETLAAYGIGCVTGSW